MIGLRRTGGAEGRIALGQEEAIAIYFDTPSDAVVIPAWCV